MKLIPTHIDGWLYVGVAVSAAVTGSLGTEQAISIIPTITLFYLKMGATAFGAGLLAGKMYRSTAFADAKTNGNGHATVTTVTVAPGTPTVDVSTKKEEPVVK